MKRFLTAFFILVMMTPSCFGNTAPGNIKEPNVSGQFYSDNPETLSSQIDQFLQKAPQLESSRHIEILIAPHAGYAFSGGVAAFAYRTVQQKGYKTVVVIAPSHHVGFDGFSVWPNGGFKTPLGIIQVDEVLAGELIKADTKFIAEKKAFESEHALEVQLPFIQKTLPGARIVPIIAGQPSFQLCEKLADTLDRLIGKRKDVLVVLSSDMSHFHSDAKARLIDAETIKAVDAMQIELFWKGCQSRKMEMCGFVPVTVGMLLAKKRGLQSEILKYATSGDVSWDKSRVVGYLSVMFSSFPKERENQNDGGGIIPLTLEQKRKLIKIAKDTVEKYVRTGEVLEVREDDPRLKEVEGAFVTIHKRGNLRGCIGNIIGQQPLYLTVRDMAVAACSQDPRFEPVTEKELADIDIEVSVLSKPRQVSDAQEIIMGTHGVIVSRGYFNKGVFLPQVATETGWNREQFLSTLCSQKAGLPADAWKDPRTKLEIFTADVFSEKDVK